MVPIDGPNFDPGAHLDPPLVEPRSDANGDGIPESARSRENTDTHVVTHFDLFRRAAVNEGPNHRRLGRLGRIET